MNVHESAHVNRQPRGRRSRRSGAWSLVVWGLTTHLGCGPATPRSLPEECLGRWYYEGSTGGIDGAGMGDPAEGYIVILADNSMDFFEENGTLVKKVKFTVRYGKAIFSEENQWILDSGGGDSEVIQLSEDGQAMSLSSNAYDGFGRLYARAR